MASARVEAANAVGTGGKKDGIRPRGLNPHSKRRRSGLDTSARTQNPLQTRQTPEVIGLEQAALWPVTHHSIHGPITGFNSLIDRLWMRLGRAENPSVDLGDQDGYVVALARGSRKPRDALANLINQPFRRHAVLFVQ